MFILGFCTVDLQKERCLQVDRIVYDSFHSVLKLSGRMSGVLETAGRCSSQTLLNKLITIGRVSRLFGFP